MFSLCVGIYKGETKQMTDRDRLLNKLKKAKNGCLIKESGGCLLCTYRGQADCTLENIADHLLANGIIVPPCKVGDMVWINYEYSKSIIRTCPVKVYAYRIDTKKNNMRICVEGYIKISAYGGHYNHYYNGTFKWDSVGKSVFLTKEEAEAELRKRSADNG